jgi:hypothetical protein
MKRRIAKKVAKNPWRYTIDQCQQAKTLRERDWRYARGRQRAPDPPSTLSPWLNGYGPIYPSRVSACLQLRLGFHAMMARARRPLPAVPDVMFISQAAYDNYRAALTIS